MVDRDQKPRGFGFVTYTNSQSVNHLLNAMPHYIDGKMVDCKRAVPKDSQQNNNSSKNQQTYTSETQFIYQPKEEKKDSFQKPKIDYQSQSPQVQQHNQKLEGVNHDNSKPSLLSSNIQESPHNSSTDDSNELTSNHKNSLNQAEIELLKLSENTIEQQHQNFIQTKSDGSGQDVHPVKMQEDSQTLDKPIETDQDQAINSSPVMSSKLSEDNPQRRKIFVGGLPHFLQLSTFREYFQQFGAIDDSVILMDKRTMKPRGFGFVTFKSMQSVELVMAQKNNHYISDKWVEVKRSVPIDKINDDKLDCNQQENITKPNDTLTMTNAKTIIEITKQKATSEHQSSNSSSPNSEGELNEVQLQSNANKELGQLEQQENEKGQYQLFQGTGDMNQSVTSQDNNQAKLAQNMLDFQKARDQYLMAARKITSSQQYEQQLRDQQTLANAEAYYSHYQQQQVVNPEMEFQFVAPVPPASYYKNLPRPPSVSNIDISQLLYGYPPNLPQMLKNVEVLNKQMQNLILQQKNPDQNSIKKFSMSPDCNLLSANKHQHQVADLISDMASQYSEHDKKNTTESKRINENNQKHTIDIFYQQVSKNANLKTKEDFLIANNTIQKSESDKQDEFDPEKTINWRQDNTSHSGFFTMEPTNQCMTIQEESKQKTCIKRRESDQNTIKEQWNCYLNQSDEGHN